MPTLNTSNPLQLTNPDSFNHTIVGSVNIAPNQTKGYEYGECIKISEVIELKRENFKWFIIKIIV